MSNAAAIIFNRIDPNQPAMHASAGLNTVSLPYDKRQRSRLRVQIDSGPLAGQAVGIDMVRGTVLRDKILLTSEADQRLLVRAAAEALIEVHAPDEITLTRLAYHLGNRHVPVQVLGNTLRLQPDHVLGKMIQGLGGTVRDTSGPFDPEGGAYAHDEASQNHHHHAHDHEHTPRDVSHAPRIHDLSANN